MILALFPSLTALGGGLELYDRQVVEALACCVGDESIHVVLAREADLGNPSLLSESARRDLTVEGSGDRSRLLRIADFSRRVLTVALREKPRLVLCGHINFAPIAHLAARLTNARLLFLTYGIESWAVGRPGVARALAAADAVVSISSFTAAQLLRVSRVLPERVVVVPNAVDTTRFSPAPPSPRIADRLSSLPRPRLLTVGRLDASEAYKGVDQVIRALGRGQFALRPSYLVVGSGSDVPRLRALASDLGVRVEFYGQAASEDLVDLYRACDLFVMPSRNEGFGYVFIEAMACGIPVIAGCVDGSVDALAGGRLGLLVNPLDVDALAEAIEQQLSGRSPPEMRDARRLHDEVKARFSMAGFTRNFARSLAVAFGEF